MVTTLCITGITGSVGRAILDHLTEPGPAGNYRIGDTYAIIGIASGESKIKELEDRYRDPGTATLTERLRLFATDLADERAIGSCVREADAVIHTAAKKHVDYVQRAPLGAFRTNVFGTLVIAEACREYDKHLVFMSTDKAVQPIGFYGWTKHVAEQIILGEDRRTGRPNVSRPAGTCVRSGNVLASSGSILTVWYKQAQQDFVTTFQEGHTRYFVERQELARLLVALGDPACRGTVEGKVVIPRRMHLWNMDTLAKVVVDYLRAEHKWKVELKPVVRQAIKGGTPEKRHEKLYTSEEAAEGKILLWDGERWDQDKEAAFEAAPPKPPWALGVPTFSQIDRHWQWAKLETEKGEVAR